MLLEVAVMSASFKFYIGKILMHNWDFLAMVEQYLSMAVNGGVLPHLEIFTGGAVTVILKMA